MLKDYFDIIWNRRNKYVIILDHLSVTLIGSRKKPEQGDDECIQGHN